MKKRVISNTLTGWGQKLLAGVIAFVTIPLLIAGMGEYEYGLWLAIFQVTSFLSLSDFGVSNSIARFVSRNDALQDSEANQRVYSAAIVLLMLAAAIAVLITFVLSLFVQEIYSVKDAYLEQATMLLFFAGALIAIGFPLKVGVGLLQAKNRFDLISITDIVNVVLQLLAVLILFYFTNYGSLLVYAATIVGLRLLRGLFIFFWAKRTYSYLSFKLSLVKSAEVRSVLSLGGGTLTKTGSAVVLGQGMLTAISSSLGVLMVPIYGIPSTGLRQLSPFLQRLLASLKAAASAAHAKGDLRRLQRLYYLGVRYGLCLSVTISVFIYIFVDEIIQLWLGRSGMSEDRLSEIAVVFSFLLIPFSLSQGFKTGDVILSWTGRHWFTAFTNLGGAVLAVGTALYLMKFTSLGIMAAVYCWSAKVILIDCLVQNSRAILELKMLNLKSLVRLVSHPVLIAIILFSAAWLIQVLNIPGGTYVSIILKAVLYFMISLFAGLWVGLTTEHRAWLLARLKRR